MIHIEGIKGGGGKVGVGEDDMSDGMQCINHSHRNNNPGGICAFCLQEKLGKLVSSSSSLPIRPSSSSSLSPSSPSFRSHTASSSSATTTRPSASITTKITSAPSAASSSSLSLSAPPTKKNGTDHHHHHYHEHYLRSRLLFLLAKKTKKKKPPTTNSPSSFSAATSDIIFKRSNSTATPRRRGQILDEAEEDDDIVIEDFNFSPRKRNGFWSFLYLSSKPSSSSSSSKKFDGKSFRDNNSNGSPRISAVNTAACTSMEKCNLGSSSLGRKSDMVVEEEDDSASASAASSLERKVSRSRSVGCGSRSFSGDFFERISTGFGDCTLRRVESQREGKPKVAAAAGSAVNHHHHHHCMKQRVRCGGIFGGFMLTSSSSSSSSASSYWVSSSGDDGMNNGESVGARGRSWGWAFASPLRAFGSKTSSKGDKKRGIIREASDKNATPSLSAIPSLLAVSG